MQDAQNRKSRLGCREARSGPSQDDRSRQPELGIPRTSLPSITTPPPMPVPRGRVTKETHPDGFAAPCLPESREIGHRCSTSTGSASLLSRAPSRSNPSQLMLGLLRPAGSRIHQRGYPHNYGANGHILFLRPTLKNPQALEDGRDRLRRTSSWAEASCRISPARSARAPLDNLVPPDHSALLTSCAATDPKRVGEYARVAVVAR